VNQSSPGVSLGVSRERDLSYTGSGIRVNGCTIMLAERA
jgi:hypothetical protein